MNASDSGKTLERLSIAGLKTVFFKANPVVFGVLLGFWVLLGFFGQAGKNR